MTALEVIKFRDVVPIRQVVRFLPNFSPLTVELRGDDFSDAEDVLINDVSVPEFMIINAQTIYAQMPSNVNAVQTLSVISSNFTRTARASRVDYKVGTKTRAISGILKLTQLFVRWLLTTPGRDVFNPQNGGGLQEVARLAGNTGRPASVMSAVVQAVSLTAEQIRRVQTGGGGLPLDERLLDATVLDLGAPRARDEVRIRVRIESVAGEDGVAALSL